MADLVVAAQLQQWTFEKQSQATRSERSGSDSSASSPILCDGAPETLRIDTATTQQPSPTPRKESIVLQDRYMSSEEALSPADDGSDSEYDYDDVVIHDPTKECKARTMSISRWDKGKSCDMAVMVSYAFVGRPKVVELDCRSPTADLPPPLQQRSASVANLPVSAISQLRAEAAQRLSMKAPPAKYLSSTPATRATTPEVELQSRRPSTSHSPSTKNASTLDLSDSSATSSFRTAPSSRSISPAVDELLARPTLAPLDVPSSARSSVYIPSFSRNVLSRTHTTQATQSTWAPPTPASPAAHAFLSSDPYESSNTDSASPIIKSGPHKRLRSISMKLALAKIAIGPTKKTFDARINGKAPSTPLTPFMPNTPQTAPLEGGSSFMSPQKLRRASTILRPKSRHDSTRGPSPDFAPPVPTMNTSSVALKRMSKMAPRGANEREPTLILPPCPSDDDDPMSSFKGKTLRKRKSLMSLMDSL